MRRRLVVLVGVFLVFQFGFSNACGMRYKLEKGKIYYYNNFKDRIEIKEVNYKTFEIISNTLAKDTNNIYYLGEKVNGVNSKTFKITKEYGELVFDCYRTSYVIEDNGNQVFLEYTKFKNEK